MANYDRKSEKDIEQRISLATGRIGKETTATLEGTVSFVRESLRNVAESENQVRYDHRGFSEREIILKTIESKSRQNGIWIEDLSVLADLAHLIGKGAESNVYLANDGANVIKLNSLPTVYKSDDIYSRLVDRIASHNELFEDCQYEILGFSLNKDGDTCIVLRQPLIIVDHFACRVEINAELSSMVFSRTKLSDFKHGWTNGQYVLRDANPRNVVVDEIGVFYFIDLIPNKMG